MAKKITLLRGQTDTIKGNKFIVDTPEIVEDDIAAIAAVDHDTIIIDKKPRDMPRYKVEEVGEAPAPAAPKPAPRPAARPRPAA